MPKHRVPTATAEAKGSFIKHPERKKARAAEPVPTKALADAPSHLGPTEQAVWFELMGKLPGNVAFDSDETSFEVLVCLVSAFRNRQSKGIPHVVGEISAMNKLFTQFGMTPADRSKVKVSNDNAQDPLEAFLGQQPSPEITQ